jgi:SAM-dependent methyltransferase
MASTWKSSSKKGRRAPDTSWAARLQPLERLRAGYLGCQRRIVDAVLSGCLPERGTLLEVGAGLGQLAHWLGDDISPRWVFTEPDAGALAQLRARFPTVNAARASLETLPFESASVGAVVGVCVLDTLRNLDAGLAEMRRVLAPGGCLIHLLDLAPTLDSDLAALAEAGKVVLPNLFSDPSSGRWPEDLLVSNREAMRRLLLELDKRQHPLPRVFGHYFEIFERAPFDVAKAAHTLDAMSREPELRELLKTTLTSAFAAGFQLRLPAPEGTLVSSSRRLAERLAEAATAASFTVEVNDLESAWAQEPAGDGEPTYRSLALGHERRSFDLPDDLLCEDARPPPPGQRLVEAAMHVFVARA